MTRGCESPLAQQTLEQMRDALLGMRRPIWGGGGVGGWGVGREILGLGFNFTAAPHCATRLGLAQRSPLSMSSATTGWGCGVGVGGGGWGLGVRLGGGVGCLLCATHTPRPKGPQRIWAGSL